MPIRGLGRLFIDSILGRDYPVVQGVILLVACIFIFMNFFVDILYAIINPRIGTQTSALTPPPVIPAKSGIQEAGQGET